MARYYEENALIEFVTQYTPTINGETTMKCVERAIHNAPTADVVPKSEYDILKSLITHKEDEAYNKGYNDALKDVEEMITKNVSERGK